MKNVYGRTPTAKCRLTVESTVPFSLLISSWLQVHSVDFCQLVQISRQYERAYLAWETVRKGLNPYFVYGTGFEGYYVGQYQFPEEVSAQLLKIGHCMLASNYRLYRFNHLFRSKLMKTLYGEIEDSKAVEVWAAQFGAELGKLRCNLLTNIEARLFQAATYRSTSSLPEIRYNCSQHVIDQRYAIRTAGTECAGRCLTFEAYKSSDEDAALVASSIGKYGHPLVRAYLNERFSHPIK